MSSCMYNTGKIITLCLVSISCVIFLSEKTNIILQLKNIYENITSANITYNL